MGAAGPYWMPVAARHCALCCKHKAREHRPGLATKWRGRSLYECLCYTYEELWEGQYQGCPRQEHDMAQGQGSGKLPWGGDLSTPPRWGPPRDRVRESPCAPPQLHERTSQKEPGSPRPSASGPWVNLASPVSAFPTSSCSVHTFSISTLPVRSAERCSWLLTGETDHSFTFITHLYFLQWEFLLYLLTYSVVCSKGKSVCDFWFWCHAFLLPG